MKKTAFQLFLVAFTLFAITLQTVASDFSVIYNRMYSDYLTNPSKSSVESLLKKLDDKGGFEGINYQAKDGSPRKHVQNLINLAAAYQNTENSFYHDADLRKAYLQSLNFWIDTNNQATNWWYRYIPYPKELSKSIILMAQEIKKDKVLFDKTIKYLRWSYENSESGRLTGANGADIIIGSLAASILTENDSQMMDFKNKMTELLTIQPVEGIQPDYLFAQHCGKGRQLYFTNYGKEFVNSMMFYLEYCNGTKYQTPGVDLLQDLFINGIQWIFYNKNYDPNNSGRYNSSDQYYTQIKGLTDRIQKLNGSKKAELKKACSRIAGENSLSGNRMFWRFDYMINRRPNYMLSTRMSSTRTVGAEAGNGDGEFNFYSGNGTNYIFMTGKEYNGNYFKKFNNRQFPGITAEQDDAKLPIPNWGENASNGDSYAGGVSDSTYGACGMILDRRELQARKSWFYFDEEFVCLGAGISQTKGKASVYTTLNQCNASGEVLYSAKGKTIQLKEPKSIASVDWIMHAKIGYFNLEPSSNFVLACDSSLFSANINHGINPKNGTYAYTVKPGVESVSEAKKYGKNIPVSIISNTEKVQAVKNTKLNVTEIMFYEAGTLKLNDGKSITVDAPCAILWKENSGQITLANPLCETNNPSVIHLIISNKGKQTELTFQMPVGVKSGSSITMKL
ncbi:MAG: polysaccharide lyase family 8 super-sandwich domain-containing protein [Paludibacter sp.]